MHQDEGLVVGKLIASQALDVAPLGSAGIAATTLLSPEAPLTKRVRQNTHDLQIHWTDMVIVQNLEIHTIHEFNYWFVGH